LNLYTTNWWNNSGENGQSGENSENGFLISPISRISPISQTGGRMRKIILAAVVMLTLVVGGVQMSQAVTDTKGAKIMTTKTGLKYQDGKVGTGKTAEPGKIVFVNYTGWLYNDGKKGRKFDSSLDRGKPFEFKLGRHMVIAGWDEGVAGMKEGGKRTLIIPSNLGYGTRGFPPVIPSNADLIFDVELVEVK